MRPGPLEIILIVVIIVVVAVLARIIRGNRIKAREAADDGEAETAPGPRRIMRRTGIAGIAVGVILLAAAVSMFRYAFQSYLWGFVIIVIGLVLVFLTRKRR